jgi:hypothetical protein
MGWAAMLIPHIDSTYRTKANRTQRAIEGISMGGFGALMLGFKYPDLFASIGSYDAVLVNWDTLNQQQFDKTIPSSIFGNDRNYFNENSYPFTFVKKNATTIKTLGIKARMITGDKDLQMGPLYYYYLAMRDTLKAHDISFDFKVISGGTHGSGMSATTVKENVIFHTTNFNSATTMVGQQSISQKTMDRIHTDWMTFSTTSSFRIPDSWQSSDALMLYSLS